MNRLWFALPFATALSLAPAARAQTTPPSPRQIQTMIAAGQDTQAIAALQTILQDHPKTAIGWYLLAQAYDAQHNEAAASDALNMAERIAPGLPFAEAQTVAALRAHINARQPPHSGHIALYAIAGLALLALLLYFLPSRGMAPRNDG